MGKLRKVCKAGLAYAEQFSRSWFFGLCTTICKSVHSTRLSGNQDFGLAQHPTTTFAPKWAELRIRCGNDAPWDLRRNLCRRFVVRPTELGNPHQTRVSTFPQRLRRRLPRLAGEPTPLELRALSDSCTEPKKPRPRLVRRARCLSHQSARGEEKERHRLTDGAEHFVYPPPRAEFRTGAL